MRLQNEQKDGPLKRSLRWWRAPFNMVELVIVVTIVVAIFSLLLPVLYNGRRFAQQHACQENLKTLASWVLLYSYNHESRMPAYEDGWLKLAADAGAQQLDQDAEPSGSFACPSQPFVSYDEKISPSAYWRGSHYGINQHIASNLTTPDGKPLPRWARIDTRAIEDPERKVMLADSSGSNFFGIPGRDPVIAGISLNGRTYADGLPPDPATPLPAMRHLNGAGNFAFLDGHVPLEGLTTWPRFMLGQGTPGYVFWHGEHWYPESGREPPGGGATPNR